MILRNYSIITEICIQGKNSNLEIPFGTKWVGLEPPEKLKTLPKKDQINRYPTNTECKEWEGVLVFTPEDFITTLEALQNDFARIKSEIFS